MPQMTTSQARVVDMILTIAAQGYKNAELVGEALFPVVPVMQRGGKIVAFNKEDFRLYATGRTPGANTRRVQYGYAGTPYSLEQHALEGLVPYELMDDAIAVPGINLGNNAVRRTQNIIMLRNEKAQADLAINAANYAASNKITLSGADQWNDAALASNPIANIETAKEAVRSLIGRRPNTVLLSAKAFNAVKVHPAIVDRIKYTGRDVATVELLASLFGVARVVVGESVYENDAGAMTDVWGKHVVVAYTEVGGVADMGLPSYGYTYRLGGYPIVEQPYQDRNAKSWVYPVTDELSPVIAGASAGYLITNAVA